MALEERVFSTEKDTCFSMECLKYQRIDGSNKKYHHCHRVWLALGHEHRLSLGRAWHRTRSCWMQQEQQAGAPATPPASGIFPVFLPSPDQRAPPSCSRGFQGGNNPRPWELIHPRVPLGKSLSQKWENPSESVMSGRQNHRGPVSE